MMGGVGLIPENFQRKENETNEELIFRICSQKELIGSWQEIADILNPQLGRDYSKDKYRKQWNGFSKNRMLKESPSETTTPDGIAEYEKAAIRYRDERAAYQNLRRIEARVEQKLDFLEELIEKQGRIVFPELEPPEEQTSDTDMIVCLSDLHIGQTFCSYWGQYDSETAADRLKQYLRKIFEIKERHGCQNCYVSIQGDLISGNIHKSLAVTNRENVIQQIKTATELISSFCYELCQKFNKVYMYNCSGNHSRIDRKEDALHDERLDDLIGWNVEHFLSHVQNFVVPEDSNIDNGIVLFYVRDKAYVACHGDYDSFSKQGISNLALMLDFIPYAILCGHRHSMSISDFSGVKMIQSGSLAGSGDNYSIENRLVGKPSQTVCVCGDNGIECYYPIEFSKWRYFEDE